VKLNELVALAQEHDIPITSGQQLFIDLKAKGVVLDNVHQNLEMSSTYIDTFRDSSDANDQFCLHSHSFYELLYCRGGHDIEYLIGTERFLLQKGDVLFLPPGVSHRPLLPQTLSEPFVRDIVWLSTTFIEQITALLPQDFNPTFTHLRILRTAGTQWEFIGDYFDAGIQETMKQEVCWEAVVVGNTLHLMTMLRRASLDPEVQPQHAEKPELLEQIITYIEENLSSKITLSETAKRFWVSESTICQTFRKRMGTSFYRYVIQRRLIAAKVLIGKGLPLEELSSQVGFSDYSAFYRAFRQEYGISPRKFRKMQEQEI